MLDKISADVLGEIMKTYGNPEILEKLLITSKKLRHIIYNTRFLWLIYIPKDVRKQRTLTTFSKLGLTECIKLLIHVSRKNLKLNGNLLQKSLQYSKEASIFYLKKGVKFDDSWFFNFHQNCTEEKFAALENCHVLGLHLSKEEFLRQMTGRNRNFGLSLPHYLKMQKKRVVNDAFVFQPFWDLYLACCFGNLAAVKLYLANNDDFYIDVYCLDFVMLTSNCNLFAYYLSLPTFVSELSRNVLLHFIETCTSHYVYKQYFSKILALVVEKKILDDELRLRIIGFLVINDRVDLIQHYLDLDFLEEIRLKKMMIKLAIESKKFHFLNYMLMVHRNQNLTCPDITVQKDYFTETFFKSTVLVNLLKLNVTFEDYMYVFEQSKKYSTVFVELLKSKIYKIKFINWCESNPNMKLRCYDLLTLVKTF